MDQLGETGRKYCRNFALGPGDGQLHVQVRRANSRISPPGRKRLSACLQLRRLVAAFDQLAGKEAPAGHVRAQLRVLQPPPSVGHFASGDSHQPLQPDSFHIRTGRQMTSQQSLHLWRLLAQNRYLLSSGEDDGQTTAKIGRSIFRFGDSQEDLEKLSTGVSVHAMAIEKLVVDSIRHRRTVTSQQFVNVVVTLLPPALQTVDGRMIFGG